MKSARALALSRRDFLRWGGAGAAGAAALSLSACSEVATGFTETDIGGPNTLILTKGPDTSGTLQGVIDKFNKEGHKFTVDWREMPADTGQYFDKMRTEFQVQSSDNDVIGADVIWPAQFAANDWLQPLDDLFTEQMQSDFLDASVQSALYKGNIYGVPWYSDAGLLYYRKDLLAKNKFKPPKTWEELRSQAQKIRESEGMRYGFVFQGSEYEGGVCNQCEYIWNAGGDILDPQDPTRVLIGEQGSVQGMSEAEEHVDSGASPLAVATYKEQESLATFITGDAVFMRNWPFAYAAALDPAQGSVLKENQVGVAHLPAAQDGQQAFACLGGWNFCISAFSQKKDQAWEFIQWMTQPEIQKEFAINAGYLPPRKSLFQDKKLTTKDQPVMGLAKSSYATTRPRPSVNPFYSDMSLDMAESFNDLLKGEETPEGAASTLDTKLSRIADAAGSIFGLGSGEQG